MLRIQGTIPDRVGVALSGGPDSMAVLNFLLSNKRRKVTALYFDHGTEHGAYAKDFVLNYCKDNDIDLVIGTAYREKNSDESPEEYWRNIRYYFLNNFDYDIITCHNLDDQVEQWIFSSLHGVPNLIPYRNKNIIRPFMLNKKDKLVSWCERKQVPFVVDPSNFSDRYMRSYIRNNIVPHALKVNPGLHKVIKKKLLQGVPESK